LVERGFGSTELDGLIASAQSGNLDLAAAETRIVQPMRACAMWARRCCRRSRLAAATRV
jgi:hypothetical protein